MFKKKMFLPTACIQFCSFLWCIIMCLGTPAIRIMNTEKREVIVFFNNDGTLMDISSVPRCESGEKINLVEYSYDQMECLSASADDCSSARNEKLLPEEELVLHEECSLRNKCRTLRFPSRLPTLKNKINAMTIKFQCIDQNIVFLDICKKGVLYFNNTLHLTLSDRTHFTDCRCWVNNGDFTMVLNDVRLTQESGSKCSPAELVISNNRWVCHGRKEDGFGSMFHDKNEDISPLGAYVSLVRKSENISPDMVWLIIYPQETARIECEGDFSKQNHGQDMTTTKPNLVRSTLTRRSTATSSTQTNIGQPETSRIEYEGDYSNQNHGQDMMTPKPNLVQSTLTRRSTATSSTQTNIGQPEITVDDPTARKSDNTWVPFFILIVVGFIVYLVFQKVWIHMRSKQQSPQNTVETAIDNTNLPSSTENIPERQSHDSLLLRILTNVEYISNQLRIRTDEHNKQATGKMPTFLQHPRKLVSTYEDNLLRRRREFSSLPTIQNTETNEAAPLGQKFHTSASDVSTGSSRQLRENMRPVLEWNTERNMSSSSRRHTTYDSSGDGDETCFFKSEANSSDKIMNDKIVVPASLPSLNHGKTTSYETENIVIKEPIQVSDLKMATSSSGCSLDVHSCQDQSSFREQEMDIRMPLIRQLSNTDTGEIDLKEMFNEVKHKRSKKEKSGSK